MLLLALAAGELLAVESRICGTCHQEIYRKYMATPMGRSSGVVNSLPAAAFRSASGMEFRISGDSFTFTHEGQEIRRRLDYYIGAGLTGRSYLTSIDGFLFQAPVSYYTSTAAWDVSPGFEKSENVNLVREVEPSCLNCHASGVRWRSGTVNGYQQPAFSEGGVSCERCHGSGEAHVAGIRAGKAIKPARMNHGRVCAQCHLPGVVTIGRSVFVWDGVGAEATVNGHFEQLARSACARASGSKLWCGTCHDPHGPIQYNGRCLNCHTGNSCTARNRANDDCIGCHMPRTIARTVQHATVTDHTISRRPVTEPATDVPPGTMLKPFGGGAAPDRDLGLAYANIALGYNNTVWGKRAIELLEKEASHGDPKVLTQLAQLLERAGQQQRACDLYERAVASDPAPVAAAVNLGNCYASRGRIEKAIPVWKAALSRNPGLEAARLNLAVAQYRTGDVAAARATLSEGLRYNPVSIRARTLLLEMH